MIRGIIGERYGDESDGDESERDGDLSDRGVRYGG
jgi:hypothetical protein